MITPASDLINPYLVGSDGKIAYYRSFMCHFDGVAIVCGEQIMAVGPHPQADALPQVQLD